MEKRKTALSASQPPLSPHWLLGMKARGVWLAKAEGPPHLVRLLRREVGGVDVGVDVGGRGRGRRQV